MFHLVLVEPEIPGNTGNIVRICAGTGAVLHLVQPLGFSIDDKALKRAGLDYWLHADVRVHENFQEVVNQLGQSARYHLLTTKASRHYADVNFQPEDVFVFGKETAGLPEEILQSFPHSWLRIPMQDHIRSLNLANTAAIMLYEGLRQMSFPGLK